MKYSHSKNRFLNVVTGVLLLLFSVYYSNISLFQHCHIINGVTIVHSHFHDNAHHNNQSGNHTASELTLIAHADHFETVTPTDPLQLNLAEMDIDVGRCIAACVSCVDSAHPYFSLRAPPVLLVNNSNTNSILLN